MLMTGESECGIHRNSPHCHKMKSLLTNEIKVHWHCLPAKLVKTSRKQNKTKNELPSVGEDVVKWTDGNVLHKLVNLQPQILGLNPEILLLKFTSQIQGEKRKKRKTTVFMDKDIQHSIVYNGKEKTSRKPPNIRNGTEWLNKPWCLHPLYRSHGI